MDFNEFAETIKAKYPEYKDRDNKILAEAMLKKYPVYADRVSFGDVKPESPKFYELEKQPGLPKGPGALIKQAGKQFLGGLSSPMPGSLVSTPLRAASETAQQLGSDVARGASTPGGVLPDIGLPAARLAGLGASTIADPLSYAPIPGLKSTKAPKTTPVESITQKATESLRKISQEYGARLNKAKAEVGLPVTKAEKLNAKEATGNLFNFGRQDVAEIADSLAGKTKEQAGAIEDFLLSGKGKADNPKVKEIRSFVDFDKIKNQSDLLVAVNRFKRHAMDLPDKARVKLASALQDKIQSLVDFTKQGNTEEGLLKSLYGDLAEDVIPSALAKSKAEMGDVLKLVNEIGPKMQKPGQAEQFLRTMVTGKSAINKDKLVAIRKLEALSGQPIYEALTEAIAKENPTLLTEMATSVPGLGPLWSRAAKLIDKALNSNAVKNALKSGVSKASRPAVAALKGFELDDRNLSELEKIRAAINRK